MLFRRRLLAQPQQPRDVFNHRPAKLALPKKQAKTGAQNDQLEFPQSRQPHLARFLALILSIFEHNRREQFFLWIELFHIQTF